VEAQATGRRWTLAACVALVAAALVAVAFQGAPEFSGPRIFLPAAPAPTSGSNDRLSTHTLQPPQNPSVTHLDVSWLLVALIVLAAVVALALLWRWLRRRANPPEAAALGLLSSADASTAPTPAPEPEPEPEHVRRGLDRAAEVLAEQREPRDAIERAWVGLEEGAADWGVRRLPAETPAEFASRVVARVAADREAAQRFLALYLRARFSSAVVTPEDVANARSAVDALRASWSDGPRGSRPSTSADRFGSRP
jgi:hypothetical protein